MLGVRRPEVILILFGVFVPTFCCDWLRRYTDLSDRCLSLLWDLGGPITEEEFPLPFPRQLYKRVEKSQTACKVTFVRNNLGHILDLYQQVNTSRVGWDADTLEEMLIVMHRQEEELSLCVSRAKSDGCFSKALGRYYVRLTNATLNGTDGDSNMWELIRSETKMHLQQMHLLVAAM
ncbi:interferon phi 1 [Hippocampus comes]|uniref:interferon phi 1 n=1 Tax=Hippocampus comes TaxID=109280 RepID=UPI00094EA0A6|nr:PREDICTED: interferon a3-like [Hippocampus comes]